MTVPAGRRSGVQPEQRFDVTIGQNGRRLERLSGRHLLGEETVEDHRPIEHDVPLTRRPEVPEIRTSIRIARASAAAAG
jgi:hypothetical protein